MTSLNTKLIAAATVASLVLTTSAFACGGNNRGGGGNNNRNNQNCNNNNYGNGGYNPYDNNYGGQAYEPFHSTYFCQPGDSFYTVALKEYGSSTPMQHIARYNRMPSNSALTPGRMLYLPSISAGGRLSASRAPAAESLATAKLAPVVSSAPATPVAPVAVERERVSVPSGSTLQLDGEKLGDETGVVRLRVSGVAMPVEVIEWTAESTKIRLPQLDVTDATKAELEVVRADGSIASTNAISLTTAAGLAAN